MVTQPRRVAEIVERVRRIEDGDVKLRVRTIEVERMLDRDSRSGNMIGAALDAALLYQLALRAAGALNRYVMGAGAVKLLWESWRARERMRKMVEQQLRFANQGSQKYDDDDVYTGKQTVDDDLDGSGEACVAGDEPMDIACADDTDSAGRIRALATFDARARAEAAAIRGGVRSARAQPCVTERSCFRNRPLLRGRAAMKKSLPTLVLGARGLLVLLPSLAPTRRLAARQRVLRQPDGRVAANVDPRTTTPYTCGLRVLDPLVYPDAYCSTTPSPTLNGTAVRPLLPELASLEPYDGSAQASFAEVLDALPRGRASTVGVLGDSFMQQTLDAIACDLRRGGGGGGAADAAFLKWDAVAAAAGRFDEAARPQRWLPARTAPGQSGLC